MATKETSIRFYSISREGFDFIIPHRIPNENEIVRLCLTLLPGIEKGKFHIEVNREHYLVRKERRFYTIFNYQVARLFPNGPKTEEQFLEHLARFPKFPASSEAKNDDDFPPLPSRVTKPPKAP